MRLGWREVLWMRVVPCSVNSQLDMIESRNKGKESHVHELGENPHNCKVGHV